MSAPLPLIYGSTKGYSSCLTEWASTMSIATTTWLKKQYWRYCYRYCRVITHGSQLSGYNLLGLVRSADLTSSEFNFSKYPLLKLIKEGFKDFERRFEVIRSISSFFTARMAAARAGDEPVGFRSVPILPTSSSISFFQIPNSLIKKDLLSLKGERFLMKTIRRLRKRSDCGDIGLVKIKTDGINVRILFGPTSANYSCVYSSKEVEVEKIDYYPPPPPPPPLYPSTMVVGVDPGRAALAGVAVLSCSPSVLG
ncbi:hypothetical protein ADUPG1_008065 [Aduncisulcus paluster]|uniref:Uncharacterized protein n=1 Tax=Aduncisulcus paluster TaxID=2918883 RepID=A0ABQ5KQL5_9EUKA|nr:hypothetical protein ADUPG1_008065 [Aduncisulcus paluster]